MNTDNTHNIDTYMSIDTPRTITQMIDRLVSTLDRNIDRLVGDMQVTKAIEVVYMLQEMREREAQYNKKTHTAE